MSSCSVELMALNRNRFKQAGYLVCVRCAIRDFKMYLTTKPDHSKMKEMNRKCLGGYLSVVKLRAICQLGNSDMDNI